MDFDLKTLFGNRKPPLIGVDIGTSGIKLVELSKDDKGMLRLEHFAIEPVPRNAIVDDNIDNIDQVAEALQLAWRKSGTSVKNVALAMPSAAVITRKIALPGNLSEEDMIFQVESEARQYIPFSLDEVSLDFDVIGPLPGSPGDVEVMVAAARKDRVEDRVAVAEAAGLKPLVMDVESYAAYSVVNRINGLMPNAKPGQVVALFRIGSQNLHLSVLVDGMSVYVREQPFGGNQLTQDIARTFGMSFEEAEIKKKTGALPEDYQKSVLRPFMENVSQEVARAIQFFFTSSPYTRVDTIFLAGGCANISGLADLIANRTRVQTAMLSPFRDIGVPEGVRERQLQNESPSYVVACGLAMRRFDA